MAIFSFLGLLMGGVLGVGLGVLDGLPLLWPAVRGLVIGLLVGTAVGIGEEVLLPLWSRHLGFAALNALRFTSYLLAIAGTLVVVNALARAVAEGTGIVQATRAYADAGLPRDLVAALVAAAALMPLIQVKRLHSAGEIWRLLTGRYHYPEEEERVFLFADLADATTHAERLGHLRYSALLRDLFADVSEAILAWRGEVYQHLGDGVVISWPWAAGIRNAAAVRCFFEMTRGLERRAETYRARYGLAPVLRGGVHGGPVVITWVGEAKRELAFHGDTLNATARIQGTCRELDVACLVSDHVLDERTVPGDMKCRSMGSVELRGRTEPVTLLAVEEPARTPPPP